MSSQDKIDHNQDIYQVSYQNMENFVRYANFNIGLLHVGVRLLIIVCALLDWLRQGTRRRSHLFL